MHLFELGADNTFLSNDIFHTYDSYTAKNEYDAIVKLNEEKYSLITDHYDSVLSLLTTPYESPLSVLSDAVD